MPTAFATIIYCKSLEPWGYVRIFLRMRRNRGFQLLISLSVQLALALRSGVAKRRRNRYFVAFGSMNPL